MCHLCSNAHVHTICTVRSQMCLDCYALVQKQLEDKLKALRQQHRSDRMHIIATALITSSSSSSSQHLYCSFLYPASKLSPEVLSRDLQRNLHRLHFARNAGRGSWLYDTSGRILVTLLKTLNSSLCNNLVLTLERAVRGRREHQHAKIPSRRLVKVISFCLRHGGRSIMIRQYLGSTSLTIPWYCRGTSSRALETSVNSTQVSSSSFRVCGSVVLYWSVVRSWLLTKSMAV